MIANPTGENLQNADNLTFGSSASLPGKTKTDPAHYEDIADAINTVKARGNAVTVEPVTITSNGTTTPAAGKAFGAVTVNVPSSSAFHTQHLTFHYNDDYDPETSQDPESDWGFGPYQDLRKYVLEALSGKACMYITLDALDGVIENPPKISLFEAENLTQDKMPYLDVPDLADDRYLRIAEQDALNWRQWAASADLLPRQPYSAYDYENQLMTLFFQSSFTDYPYATFTNGIIKDRDEWVASGADINSLFQSYGSGVSNEIKDCFAFGGRLAFDSYDNKLNLYFYLVIANIDLCTPQNSEYSVYNDELPGSFTLHVIRLAKQDEVSLALALNPELP